MEWKGLVQARQRGNLGLDERQDVGSLSGVHVLPQKLCLASGGYTHAMEKNMGDGGMQHNDRGPIKQIVFLSLYE